jgi:hypothetical protein
MWPGYVSMRVCGYVCVCAYVCLCVCVCVCVDRHICILIKFIIIRNVMLQGKKGTHTNIDTIIHTHTLIQTRILTS